MLLFLPGCMTQGETFEETKENIKDAIEAYIEVLKEDKDPIPVEGTEHISNISQKDFLKALS
jgi:predicted RNase H-like HicB family nuclease